MITKRRKIRKSYQNTLLSILFGLFLLGLITFLFFSSLKLNKRRVKLTAEIENLKKEIQTLEEKNTTLRAGISQATKEVYWEEKIREQGYKKPGEEAVVVLPPEEGEKEIKREEEGSLWNPQNWWGWIKNKVEEINL